jgi:hypothetical protein
MKKEKILVKDYKRIDLSGLTLEEVVDIITNLILNEDVPKDSFMVLDSYNDADFLIHYHRLESDKEYQKRINIEKLEKLARKYNKKIS